MSKLDELIKELCPDGVEYRSLGDVCEVFTGGEAPEDSIKEKTPRDEYIYPIYSNGIGENALWGFAKTYRIDKRAVTFSSIGTIGYPTLREPYFIPIIRLKVLIPKDETILSVLFLKYSLEMVDFEQQKSSVPNINANMIKALKIPVPPLPVQEEIVRILDTFTSLTAELTAELTARRKQYEYYRDLLLTRETKVERFKIKDLFDTRNGYTPSTSNSDFWDNGTIPWFVMEDIRENGRVLSDSKQHITESAVKKSGLFPANSIIVATSATIGEHALITSDFLCNQRFTCLSLKTEYKSKIDMKYMFYYAFKLDEFCKRNTTKSSFASVDMGKFYDFEFPLPPLGVQERIVNVLDNFDSICTDLKIGLPAEIEARKKQYEYYRDMLLTFIETGAQSHRQTDRQTDRQTRQGEIALMQYVFGYAIVRLGEIATDIYRGTGITRDQVTEDGASCVRYGEIYTTYGIWFDKCVSHTHLEEISSRKFFEHGDILFAITGESVEDIAKSTAYVGDEKCLAGGDIVVMKHKQNPKFLSYVLSTTDAQKQKGKGKVKSKVVHSSVPAISEIIIPLPTLEEQERIVRILDRFDSLCNDISSGLPAEIEARQKQYEYYRDKLLTFERKV